MKRGSGFTDKKLCSHTIVPKACLSHLLGTWLCAQDALRKHILKAYPTFLLTTSISHGTLSYRPRRRIRATGRERLTDAQRIRGRLQCVWCKKRIPQGLRILIQPVDRPTWPRCQSQCKRILPPTQRSQTAEQHGTGPWCRTVPMFAPVGTVLCCCSECRCRYHWYRRQRPLKMPRLPYQWRCTN
jgi:hypothetical protein